MAAWLVFNMHRRKIAILAVLSFVALC